MKIVIAGRQEGKTYQAVQWVKEYPDKRAILCANYMEAKRLQEQYELEPEQTRLMGQPMVGYNPREIIIDNADWVLRNLMPATDILAGLTLNV